MTDGIPDSQLVEVAAGRLKPFGKCSPIERRRAIRISERKQELIERHVELLKRYHAIRGSDRDGLTRIPGYSAADLPILGEVSQTGRYPPLVLLPDLEAEVETLEQVVLETEAQQN